MNDEENIKLSKLACKITSMTAVLSGYCENFEDINEVSNLIEFMHILDKTSNELFDLI